MTRRAEKPNGQGVIKAEVPYAAFRTRPGGLNWVYNVSIHIDEIIEKRRLLKFSSRLSLYESKLIFNSLIYPM